MNQDRTQLETPPSNLGAPSVHVKTLESAPLKLIEYENAAEESHGNLTPAVHFQEVSTPRIP